MALPSPGRKELFWSQFEEVKAAAQVVGIDLKPASAATGHVPAFVYQDNHLLIAPGVNPADQELRRFGAVTTQVGTPADRAKLLQIDEQHDVVATVRALNEFGHLRGRVAPNHLASICPVNLCPGTEPQPLLAPTTHPLPAWSATPTAGQCINVHVIDTGLVERDDALHPWLYTASGTTDGMYKKPPPGSEIGLYEGHGTFVGGVVKWFAPGVNLYVARLMEFAGAIMEDALADGLLAALDQEPQIISLSAGFTTLDHLPPLALEAVRTRLRQDTCKTLLVAAAGNDGDILPFWPAAWHAQPGMSDKVISVGALRGNQAGRACFSNYGNWVRVYAQGENHVNAFASGKYTYHEPKATECLYYPGPTPLYPNCTCISVLGQCAAPQQFSGMARWSGTSFATPLVAGRIAAYQKEHGLPDARTAAQQFLTQETVPVDNVVTSAVVL